MPIQFDITKANPDPSGPGTDPIIEAGAIAAVLTNEPSGLANLGVANAVVNNNHSSQNAVSNQQAISKIGLVAISKATQMVSTATPEQASASQQILTGNPVAESIAAVSALRPIHPIPNPLPSGTIYAKAPLYLLYDNQKGFGNIAGVAVNKVQNPILSNATVYGDTTQLPLVFIYTGPADLQVTERQIP